MVMKKQQENPFKDGQLAEARSFIPGYRSAWFRCEIRRSVKSKGQMRYTVKYYDYEEDGLEWVKLYVTTPKEQRGLEEPKQELMLRPHYPPIYHENNLPDVNTISETIVVVDGVWSVGDKVDWWKNDCYWVGTITKILDDDTVKIKLPNKPVGEGGSYVVSCKDLRPSLEWSPELSWTFPAPLDSRNGHSHVRLIRPVKPGMVNFIDEDEQNAKGMPRSSSEFDDSISSHTSASSLPSQTRSLHSKDSSKQSRYISGKETCKMRGPPMELDTGGSAIGKPSCSDSVSSTYVRDFLIEVPVATSSELQDHKNGSAKRMRVNEPTPLNSTTCDSMDSAILDLEELVNRVKWLKQTLKSGIPSKSVGHTWEFPEHSALSTPK